MKKFIAFFFLLVSVCSSQAQIKLSPEARISVITCGPWQGELYSAFGHSAFRVYDPLLNIDLAFNYGVFDFDQPNFYLNFARGYLYYKLGVYEYPLFEEYYIYHGRFIHEQVLNLTPAQKQRLFDYLEWNALPENQNYRYDYFNNNCATKIHDVVKEVFGDTVTFNMSYITTRYSLRELTDLYLKYQPWGDLGIDICLGLPIDREAPPEAYRFLPDYIESAFDYAVIQHNNRTVPLVKQKNIIFEPEEDVTSTTLFHPLLVTSLLFVIAAIVSYRDIKRKSLLDLFDMLFLTALGLIGWLLIFLWTATDHETSAMNMNLLWALPTHLIVVFAFKQQPGWLEKYFLSVAVLSGVLLLVWYFLPQDLHYALIPVVMAITLRAGTQYFIRREARIAQGQSVESLKKPE